MVKIVSTAPFGDVDYGPSAGVTVVATLDDGETADDVYEYFTRNYQDDWQEATVTSTEGDTVTMNLFVYWGDHHRSEIR